MEKVTTYKTFDGIRHETLHEARKHLLNLEDRANTTLVKALLEHNYRSAVDLVWNRLDDLDNKVSRARAIRDDLNELEKLENS